MKIKKIISGGQTGADMGGLLAGYLNNIPTEGHVPKHCNTEYGSNYTLKMYNLKETNNINYTSRTRLNVANSDGTIIFGYTSSSGTKFTIDVCKELNKAHHIVPEHDYDNEDVEIYDNLILDAKNWIIDNNISILNVAGNRESKNPGLQRTVFWFLTLLQQEIF